MSWLIFGIGVLIGALSAAVAIVLFLASQVGVSHKQSRNVRFIDIW